MDIKLKNIPYNISVKFLGILLLIIALILIIDYQYIVELNNEYFYKDSFYETDEFQQNYVRLSHNVVEKELDLISEEVINSERSGNDEAISLSRLQSIEDNLRRSPSFIFVLKNTEDGRLITNINNVNYEPIGNNSVIDYISSFKTVIQWESDGLYFPLASEMENQPLVYQHYQTTSQYATSNVTAEDVVIRLRDDQWTYYSAVDYNLMEDDITFGPIYYAFEDYKNRVNQEFPWLVFSIAVLFLTIIYLSLVIGKKNSTSEVKLFFYDYIPLEIQTLVTLLAYLPLVRFQNTILATTDTQSLRVQLAMYAFAFFLALTSQYLSIVRLIKSNYIYKNPISLKIIWWIRSLFSLDFVNPLNKLKILFLILGYVVFDSGLIFIVSVVNQNIIKYICVLFFIAIHIVIATYLLAIIRDLTSLIEATKRRAAGEGDYPIKESNYQIAFHNFAADLNALQNGLQVALDEAIKGEKMKTELITNVSHDLKNPLTSIITYIDLLDKSLKIYNREETTGAEAIELQNNMDEYIRILNNKSYRLKTLIEDLVSASKASSGNLNVELMTINIRQLVLQILGEREEYFVQEELEVVITPLQSGPIWSVVDPNHMYRVFENLISNIIKYSLKGTRVFIGIEEGETENIITFKNTSNHPLDYENKDLSARFVRGDESRTTEGSGLGLSIVESLMKLQKGKQVIDVDGDLFKVLIYVPKGSMEVKEEMIEIENNDVVELIEEISDVDKGFEEYIDDSREEGNRVYDGGDEKIGHTI